MRSSSLDLSFVVTRREVRDTISDWRVIVPTLTLAILFPTILVLGMKWGIPYMNQVDPLAAITKAALFGAMMSAFFPISFSLVIALESFVGEKERNTIEALLATPVSNSQLFIGKFVAVMAPPLVLSLLALGIYLVGLWFAAGITVPPSFVLLTVLLSASEALIMVGGAVIVSSQAATVKAANLLASFIVIPVALAVQGQVMLILLGYGHILWLALAAFLGIAAILLRMGVTVFDREAILTRENDDLNIVSIARKIALLWNRLPRSAFEGEAAGGQRLSAGRLFLADIPQILALHKAPLLVTTGMLVAGCLTGYAFALAHPLPIAQLEVSAIMEKGESLGPVIQLSPQGIFLHNIRTIVIAGVLSIFTFGVAGIMVVVASFGLVGFLLGEAALAGTTPALFFSALLLPHGLLEVPALLVASALSLKVGMSILSPPPGVGYGENLLFALVNWVKGAALFVPLFMLAAVVEAKVTPQIAFLLFGLL